VFEYEGKKFFQEQKENFNKLFRNQGEPAKIWGLFRILQVRRTRENHSGSDPQFQRPTPL
jgi:hypothetical protein